jgi:hypothetical protein
VWTEREKKEERIGVERMLMVQLRAEARILSALRFEIISLRNSAWVAKVNEYNMQSKGNASKDSESRSEQPASKTQQAAEPLKPDSPQAWISSTVNDSYPRFQQDHDDMLQYKLYLCCLDLWRLWQQLWHAMFEL